MSKRVITVDPETEIKDAVKIMAENNISGLVVVERGKIVGILSESDILKVLKSSFPEIKTTNVTLTLLLLIKKGLEFYKQAKSIAKLKVKDLMTKNVISIKPDNTIEEAATIMCEKDIRRLPVVDEDGNLIGIISRTDILKSLVKE